VAYTYRLVSPQDYPIGFLEEFYKMISKDDWSQITSRPHEAIDKGGVLRNISDDLQEKLHLQDQEENNLIATHPREIIPQAKGRSCSTSMAWGVHSSQPWFEVCNMIHVKYILPHHRIGRVESRENEAKKTHKLLHPSRPRINARLWRQKK
jgi:hypothetical protein